MNSEPNSYTCWLLPMYRRSLLVLLALAPISFMIGCGNSGPKLYQVKGTVTHNGKPVQYLYITFAPDQENTKSPSTGSTDQDGKFEMKIGSEPGVFPGEVTVTAHDPLIAMGSKTSSDPDYLAVCKKYAPGKSTLKLKIEKNESNLELKLD